jgi:hypothetical protein
VLTTFLDLLGAVLVSAGVAFVFWPAGLIVGGCLLLAASRKLTA